jgi:pimeloyl-ACP methyl ester carboxylesterase
MTNAYVDAVTKTVDVNGTAFVYRETGEKNGVPVVLLHHLTAVLDDWDPRTIHDLAQEHRVIAFNNRGVGASKGATSDTIDDMATDAVAFIRALGLTKTDLLGFSLGGFIAQVIAQKHPDLVRRIILAGTSTAAARESATWTPCCRTPWPGQQPRRSIRSSRSFSPSLMTARRRLPNFSSV